MAAESWTGGGGQHCLVLVFGDVGRSPRMQYQALSLARLAPDVRVSLVGYTGEQCMPEVREEPRLREVRFAPPPRGWSLPLRALAMFWAGMRAICSACAAEAGHGGGVDLVLVQNPPSIPSLLVAALLCAWYNARLFIDWHNLGWSMFQGQRRSTRILRSVCRSYESMLARWADGHLCVTSAMRDWLRDHFGVLALPLHDQPPAFFKPTSDNDRATLFHKLGLQDFLCPGHAVLVSSTSWTPDEDFSILLDALVRYEEHAVRQQARHRTGQEPGVEWGEEEEDGGGEEGGSLPDLLVVITGKGPQREQYLKQIETLEMQHVHIRSVWLEPEDYPVMIGAAHLGVCLHTSTSGLDLPMKVLDMFGCRVPVCAVKYACIGELVKHDHNGLVFADAPELSEQLLRCVRGLPQRQHEYGASATTEILERLSANLQDIPRWQETWTRLAQPLFLAAVRPQRAAQQQRRQQNGMWVAARYRAVDLLEATVALLVGLILIVGALVVRVVYR